MKKQDIRRIILYILAYSFPISFLFLSPIIPFEGIFFGGIVVGSLIVFAALFFLSLFFGRIYCGWICPGGAYQEAFCSFVNNKPVNTKVGKIKFIIWVPWVMSIIACFIMVGGIKKIDFLFNTYFSAPFSQLSSKHIRTDA